MRGKRDIIEKYVKFVMPTYTRTDMVFARGKGVTVWDTDGNEYLDFFPGWAVSGIGHCHKRVVSAIKAQAERMIHVSNNYYNELQAELAERIVKHAFPGKVFFSNSGAEANECAIKLARKYGAKTSKYEIITMENSFHGRTMATITATGQDKVKKGFAPLLEGFKSVPFNDIDAVRDALTDKTVAIMLEPIQGEGGINMAKADYLVELRKLCDEREMLLIFDEIQTGMGRTGKMFCYKHYGVVPDVMTLAKSLGGGMPIGATVAASRISDTLMPGTHASTFGGSPIVCAAALATFDAIEKEKLLNNAKKMGEYLKIRLAELVNEFFVVKGIKGLGLMLGLDLSLEAIKVAEECFRKRLLINSTQTTVLRIMPPLTVTRGDIDKAIHILREAILRVRPE